MLTFNSPFTYTLPNQVLQRESVAAKLDFGLPGSVVLGRASLLLMRLVESGFRARARPFRSGRIPKQDLYSGKRDIA